MTQHASLKSQLLIAMPNLEDPNFSRTVTYICEHGEHGAMGIVLNRPTELRLSDILQHMKIDADTGPASDQIVFSAARSRRSAASCCTPIPSPGTAR